MEEDNDHDEDHNNHKSVEAEEEEDRGRGVSVATSEDAMLAGPKSPPATEPLRGCSAEVGVDWLRAIEKEAEMSMGDALELLNQSQNFETVCRRPREKLGATLGLRAMRGTELEHTLRHLHELLWYHESLVVSRKSGNHEDFPKM